MSFVESQLPQELDHSHNPTFLPFPNRREKSAKFATTVQPSRYLPIKPAIDWLLTALLLIPALPVLLLIAGAIAVLDGRPIFYQQVRIGKSGRRFGIYKFRTMVNNAETKSGAIWCQKDDQRITKIGRYLRASHLDELPQIWNILKGDMSLIGPRPERPEFVERLIEEIPNYEDRHQVRPGITGLAQIKQGYDGCLSDVRKKVEIDLDYIESATLLQDIQILAMTVPHVTKEVMSTLLRRLQTSPSFQPEQASGLPLGSILRFDVAIHELQMEDKILQDIRAIEEVALAGDLEHDRNPTRVEKSELPASHLIMSLPFAGTSAGMTQNV